MLSSGPGLLSHSHAGCAQFIGPVSTNRHASHSIAKSVLFGVQFLFYVILLMVTPSYCFPELLRLPSPPSPFAAQFFCCPLYHSPFIKPVFIFVSCFSGSPTSASSYCGSGEGGSQSGENAPAEVCVSWWKPSSQSPLDQGKSSPPSVMGALWHSATVTKMSNFSVRTCPNLSHRTIWDPRHYMHPLLHFFSKQIYIRSSSERGGSVHHLGGRHCGAEVDQHSLPEAHPRRQPGGGVLRELQPGVPIAFVRQREAHGAL